MTEAEGRAVLKDRFEAAGIAISEDHRLQGDGYDIVVDGFDPAKKVGYEFITTEAGDRVEFDAVALEALERQMAAGQLFLLLIDEEDVPEASRLAHAAELFLGELRTRGFLS